MKNKITKLIALAIALFSIFGLTAPAYAVEYSDPCEDPRLPAAAKETLGCEVEQTSQDLSSVIQAIVNGIILVLGVVAVIVIVYGGIQYMASAGDAGKLKKAKDTILYACIGLIICVLSFAIVNFVVINIIGGNRSSSSTLEGGSSEEEAAPQAYIPTSIAKLP